MLYSVVHYNKQFKNLFTLQDPLLLTPSSKTSPNYKIDPLFLYILCVSQEVYKPGWDLSIDKQDFFKEGIMIYKN